MSADGEAAETEIVGKVGDATVTLGRPSQQIVKAAEERVTVTDSRGRLIELKRPPVIAQFRFIEALGDAASNQTYVGMCLPLIFVTSIDGTPVAATGSKSEVEALIQRLDEDGVQAVMNGVQEHFAAGDPDASKKSSGAS